MIKPCSDEMFFMKSKLLQNIENIYYERTVQVSMLQVWAQWEMIF